MKRWAAMMVPFLVLPLVSSSGVAAPVSKRLKLQDCAVTLAEPVKSVAALPIPLLPPPIAVKYKIPLWGDYAIRGAFDAFDSGGEQQTDKDIREMIHSLLRRWVESKERSIGQRGVDFGMAMKDLAALQRAFNSERPYEITGYEVFGVDPSELPGGLGGYGSRKCSSSSQAEESDSSARMASGKDYPCPFPIPGDAIPVCDKQRNDLKWAANSGYWDMHFNHVDGADMVHVLFMYTTWTDSSRLSLFTSNNDGFEVNTWFKFSPYPEPVNSRRTIWGSDYPGAHLEDLTSDDSSPTYAVGSDRAENLVAGRQYQNQIWVTSPYPISLTGTEIGYYQQVDLDMVSNGDAGFFADEACGGEMGSCIRSMNVGQYESW